MSEVLATVRRCQALHAVTLLLALHAITLLPAPASVPLPAGAYVRGGGLLVCTDG